jgi:hypothetical protein
VPNESSRKEFDIDDHVEVLLLLTTLDQTLDGFQKCQKRFFPRSTQFKTLQIGPIKQKKKNKKNSQKYLIFSKNNATFLLFSLLFTYLFYNRTFLKIEIYTYIIHSINKQIKLSLCDV